MSTALEHRGTFWARELEVAGDRQGSATIPGNAAAQLRSAMLRRAARRPRRVRDRIISAAVSIATGALYARAFEHRDRMWRSFLEHQVLRRSEAPANKEEA